MLNQKFTKSSVILILILLLAIFLRIYQLGDSPRGLHNDEVANTYATKFILLNGKDIYGNKLPLLFMDKFGDYPPILPMYLSGLGTLIFGNNEFGSRALIAVTGALLVIPVYLLSLLIFKKKETALFSAFIVAVTPVHMNLSRLNAEGIVALTVFFSGLFFFLQSFFKSNKYFLIIGLVLLLSTYLIYPSYRILIPLILAPTIILAFYYKTDKLFKTILISSIVLSFVLTLAISSTYWGKGRFEQTSILSPVSGVENKLQQLIFNEKSIFVARMFHNKIIGYGFEFIYQYLSYFSPNYIFGQEGIPLIYMAPYSGLLYFALIPLFILSIIGYFQSKNKQINHPIFIFVLYLMLLAPIPAALTILDVPSIHRSLPFFILLILVASYGYNSIANLNVKKIPIKFLVFILLTGELVFYFHNYFSHISIFTSVYRNDGNKEAMQYILANQDKYDKVLVTNKELWLPTYYLFYKNDYDPKYIGKFQRNFRLPQVGNVSFVEHNCPSQLVTDNLRTKTIDISEKILVIDNIDCNPKQGLFNWITSIKRLGETRAYEIYALNNEFLEERLDQSIY